ncbi:hypothetical protein CTHBC1_2678 [Acetivibrio thermocellus BC1]|nr:hypothetical protein CTHBC1_2678 [Acetivibrio thermocellus BC1]
MPDINFLNINANDLYRQIIEELENGVGEPLYPGDERRIFAEALVPVFLAIFSSVNDAAKQKMLRYARGTVLDALGERTNTKRLEAQPARTILRFIVSKPQPFNIIIPKWTKATPDANVYFATDEEAILKAGTYSVDVPASSVTGGSFNNGYAPDTITTLVDLIPFISGVTNIVTTYGGDDGEPYTEEGDEHYRERIRLASSKFSVAGPQKAYIYWAKTADPEIEDVAVLSPSAGVVKIVPLLKGGEIPDETVLKKVLAVTSADDIRPLTDHVIVEAPAIEYYDIELKYYTTASNEGIVINNIEGPGGAIERYIQWQDTALGRDINPDQLKRFILSPTWAEVPTGALRVDVIKPVFTPLTKTKVARFSGNLIVTHEVVEE